MHVVFVLLPLPGHVNPTLAVIAELRRRGTRVSALASSEMAPRLQAAGAEVVACDEVLPAETTTPPEGMVRVGELLLSSTPALLEFTLKRLRQLDPDVLVHDSMTPWGRLAARLLGRPSVCSTATFAFDRRVRPPLREAARLGADVITHRGSLIRLHRRRRDIRVGYGIDPGGLFEVLSNREGAARTIVYTSPELQPGGDVLAAELDFVGPSMPEQAPIDPGLEAEIAGRPLIYVSLGTVFNERPRFFRDCLESFAGREEVVLLSIGDRFDPGALGEPPANAIVRRSVPQLAVLERARLFVTHAGMNSASEALWFGVPTLLHPQTADQPVVAARLAQLGAGRMLSRSSPRRIAAEAERVLAGGYARRARELGETLRACGGPPRAADVITEAAGG
jgi:MGT family glycosyltransferase